MVRLDRIKFGLTVVALLVFCIGVPWMGWGLMRIAPGQIIDTPKPTYSELVLIVLAAVTVVLAVLAIIVAILAVWGYENIKREASTAADRAVKSTVEAAVSRHANDEKVKALIKKELARILGESITQSTAYAEAFPATDGAAQQGTVGTDYPGGDANDGQAG